MKAPLPEGTLPVPFSLVDGQGHLRLSWRECILPLSGGLDSRTQSVALNHLKADVVSYSYEFENGYPETKIAKQIAKACGFEFKWYTIPKGYLWEQIDVLAELNQCYSDFTSPRQMGIFDAFSNMGELFSLGHWGDVLFDSGIKKTWWKNIFTS